MSKAFQAGGLFSFEDLANSQRYLRLTHTAAETAPGLLPGYDDYNPSGEVDGIVLLRREKRRGRFTGYTQACTVTEQGLELVYDGDGSPIQWSGEDPGLFKVEDILLARGVRPKWPPGKFDINKALHLSTVWRIGPSIGRMGVMGNISGKGYVPVTSSTSGQLIGAYARPQLDVRNVALTYVQLNDPRQLLRPRTFEQAKLVGRGIFREGTGGGPNGAWDTGDGEHNLLLLHYARDLEDVEVAPGMPKPAEYGASLALHNRLSNQFFNLGTLAVRADWDWDRGITKYPGRENIVYPSSMHDVTIGSDGYLRGKARAGLSDAQFGIMHFESTAPYEDMVNDMYATAQ